MRLILSAIASVVIVIISGCGGAGSQPGPPKAADRTSVGQPPVPSRLETVAYDWENERIRVTFYRGERDSAWTVTVRDAWDVLDQSLGPKEKVWGLSECRCSTEECLRIMDRSLAAFHAEKPDAKLDLVAVEMEVSKDLWCEILAGLSRRLSRLNGEKLPTRTEVPDEVDDETRHVLAKSATTAAIKTLLRKHGVSVRAVYIANPVLFKDSLSGRKWSDIAALPDVGILVPGVIEFDFDERPLK